MKKLLTKQQFSDLYLLSKKLLKQKLDNIGQINSEKDMASLDQAHQMFNGAIELIANAYTDINEEF